MTKRFTKKNQYVSSFLNKPFSKHNLETLKKYLIGEADTEDDW